MKKLILVIFIFLGTKIFSQENLFQKLKQQLKEEFPELNIENKLIMLNIWSVNDSKTREANIQLNKTLTVYHNSKLKGGRTGIIGVVLCKDEDENLTAITLSKDKVLKPISIKNLIGIDMNTFSNVVYDCEGKVVYKNLNSENIYESIHQLITR